MTPDQIAVLDADALRFRAERDARLARGGPLPLTWLASALYAMADARVGASQANLIQAADLISAQADRS